MNMATPTPKLHPKGNKVAAHCSALTFCMICLVAARLYTRIYIVKSFGADDGFLVFGAVSFVCLEWDVPLVLNYYYGS